LGAPTKRKNEKTLDAIQSSVLAALTRVSFFLPSFLPFFPKKR
jgi:hypothetical protein